ncbi:NAD(P)-binding protein [Psychrobacillus sp. FJAT-51614]|uniref:NAD(P)-binding protein n=1 Tax=Psychrobacillus mangrovi TaxID=3117745 RepID=A0ABU8F5J2_9BACI
MAQQWDVVIVGGGLAGYVAANYLAKMDMSILIVEKGKKVGGRARTEKINQHYFNLGPHALYKKGKAAPILEELGIKLNGKSPKLGGILIENDIEYTAPFDPLGLLTTRLLNWREKMEWVAILKNINSLDTEKLAKQTFQQWVMQVTLSKRVQSLLYTLGRLTTYCHAPEMVSARVIVSHMKIGMDMEIASIIEKNEENCRKIYSRSKQKIARIESESLNYENNKSIINRFIHAFEMKNMNVLLDLISENVTLYSDGGGKVNAAIRPITSISNVLALLYGVVKKAPKDFYFEIRNVNGQPALVNYMNGSLQSIVSFYISHERINEIYIIMNPDKLPKL